FIAETKAKEGLTAEQKATNKALIQQKKAEFKAFEKKVRDEYMGKAKELKVVLTETEKKAKKQVAEYKAQVTDEYKQRQKELKQRLASASGEEKAALKQELAQLKVEFENQLSITKAEAKRRALEIMREVGIPEPERRFEQYPFEFSGGMRQRIVIAIALTASPEILICDEPTTALDVTIQAQILELINKIKAERNLSCIFITHDLGVVANMADRVAVMYAGKIVEYGTADEIFYDPRHPYTWALLSSIPDVDSKEKLEAIPGTPPNMIYPPKGDAFAIRSKYAMNIDFREEPPFFKVSDTHYAATWLLDEKAPKVEMPRIVSERIRNSLAGGAQ
ncbi:MAG: ATP-binding cassette domain-containing protein, partial [Firmicutes bacterium]|nr:ATP-binding cassette domain-containing protein [Bacillota bacterium]